MPRPYSGMDPSPLLPLGVLLGVMVTASFPLTFRGIPVYMGTAQQMPAFLWLIPVVLVAVLLLPSSGMFDDLSSPRYRRPVYRYPQSPYGGESGPSWGLLGLMLLMLLLLPWRY